MASRSFSDFVEHELGKFPHFLIYALLEWIMIIMLFLDGLLAFISNEYAKFFELRIPCLLCTRIDHILVRKSFDFYYNESICEGHKKDISSLAYCHVHRKLCDIRGMCEGCLLSFATEKESNTDTYKSLVGILPKDGDSYVEDDPKFYMKSAKKDDVTQFQRNYINRCSCCGDPLKMRPSKGFSRSLSMNNANIQSKNNANNVNARLTNNANIQSIGPTPSPRAPIVTWRNGDWKTVELPQIKLVSDSELEVPDDEDGLNPYNQQSREEIKAATLPLISDSIDMNEEAGKTPSFRGNKFFGISLSDFSPRWSNRVPRKMQLEKSDLFTESNDANTVKDSENESILHRLKRQVRLDRKCLIALYMELDEERSAAAIAANNAMAMITRLQAEKAAVQMEALQYQRMMEEQAEYDQEAIQILKDALLKREDEIKVLESDLEIYREKYGHLSRVGSEECEVDAEDYQEMKSQSVSSFGEKSDSESPFENDRNAERPGENGGETADVSHLDFENERSYLMSIVTTLEKKINTSLDEGTRSSELDTDTVDHDEHEETGHVNKATLTREMSLIRERLRSIEADSGFLKHSAMTLQKGGEGTKLLSEIAQHLRKLRQFDKTNETDDA